MTVSELLFEELCTKCGFQFEKIVESSKKSPDYFLQIRNYKFVVEVKQIDLNKEEKQILNTDPALWGEYEATYGEIPGQRIRSKIRTSMRQMKAVNCSQLPFLLVIYNNTDFWDEYTSPESVRVAMYGIEAILISSKPAPGGGATILSRWYGPEKSITISHNTSLSGIAILKKTDDGISLDIYHNYFAKNKLPQFEENTISHYCLEDAPDKGFPRWVAAK